MADELNKESAEERQAEKLARSRVLASGLAFNENDYTFDDRYRPGSTVEDVHSTPELFELLRNDKSVQLEGSVLARTSEGFKRVRINTEKFLEGYAAGDRNERKLRESIDQFGSSSSLPSGDYVGADDYLPFLGGPFYKQLYYYDYIRMHSACFYAFHHDPVARAIVAITRDFTLGRGWRVDCDNPIAKLWWDAFSEVNDLYGMMENLSNEFSIYGEDMIWWLPNNQTKITYDLGPGQEPPKGIIPRIRLVDPSCIWEIVTYPEDMTRVLFYQWVAPTQYQMYTYQDSTGKSVPTSKFIYQQIPANEMMHFKLNSVSNEKRGRSDLFPVLGYMKRLRDSVNYSIIGMQKSSAWSIDTTVKGSQADIDQYVADQKAGGTIAPAGSEYVHTEAIVREYLSNTNQKGSGNDAFEWALSMIAAGSLIPISYFGTHLSGGQTRASALVATEPVAKKFEMRQQKLRIVLKALSKRLFASLGLDAEIEVTFPEIVTQDRTAKLKDLALAASSKWISQKRAAQIAAKELGIVNYDYTKEMADIESEIPPAITVNPLTGKGIDIRPEDAASGDDGQRDSKSAVTSDDRRDIAMNRGA